MTNKKENKTNEKSIKYTAPNGAEVEMVFNDENCDKVIEHIKVTLLDAYQRRIRGEK